MPKRGVNAHENEIARAYKTVNDNYIEPISFIVPRRSENFQDDIYPPTAGLTPAMSAADWLSGKEALPPKISMASLYEGEGLKEVTGVQDKPTTTVGSSDSKPEPEPQPKPTPPSPVKKAPEPAPEPVSEATPVVKPAPSMKEQGASMAAMVNKFTDSEEDREPVNEDSSFDEVPKPVERPSRSATEAESPSVKSSPWHQKEEPKSRQSPVQVRLLTVSK